MLVEGRIKAMVQPGTGQELLSSAFSPRQNVTIVLSAAARIPRIVVSAPRYVSTCSVLTIDLSSSVGSGGLAWASIHYSVTSDNPSDNSQGRLASYLNTNFSNSIISRVRLSTLGNDFLAPGSTYVVNVEMCNFVGLCGSSSFLMTSTTESVLTVLIAGSPARQLRRSDSFKLSVNVVYLQQSCDGALSPSPSAFTFEWAVYQDDIQNISISSVANSAPYEFRLDPFVFSVQFNYEVKVLVRQQGTGSIIYLF